ncbi:MAG TPA: ABC transporter permease, partial [Thermoanaerobaculia bacterium]
MGSILGDLRLAWRMLCRSPGFAAVAVTALALAIGANTAIFSVIDTLLVRSYPFRDPERLAVVTSSSPERGVPAAPVSFPTYLDLRGAGHAFEDLAAVRLHSFNLSGIAEPTRTTGAMATANLLPLIGAQMVAGRTFLAAEEVRGAEPVLVLSHSLWQRSFGADPAVVGRTVRLNDQPYRVIGVLAPGTQFPDSTQAKLFVPIAGDASTELREMRAYSVLGRLKGGAQLEQARSEAAALAGRLAREYPASDAGWGLRVASLRETLTARYRTLLYILFGVVAFVLLIACANIANLLLQRAVIRRREMAIRAALGARRGQLVAQLLRESLLLALLGAAVGVVLAEGLLRLLVRLTPVEMPDFVRGFDVDYTVLGFALLVAVVTAVACGLAPALSSSRPDLARSLGEAGAAVGGRRRALLGALVVGEVTLAVVLLVGAGLMVRS